jgi:hypothetical protein
VTDAQPPEERKTPQSDAPYLAKRRLPFETGEQRHPGVIGAGILYGAATLACFGLAVFMALVQQQPLASVQVVAPFVGGVWFLIRMLMVLRPRIRKD